MAHGSMPFSEAVRYWLKLGFISFGGPTGQIAMMHKELVEKKKWIAEDHFLQAELLHAPARTRGAAARHLHRLAAEREMGRDHCRRPVRSPLHLHSLGARLDLCVSRQRARRGGALLRLEAGGRGHCAEAVLRIGKKSLKTRFLYSLAAAAFVGDLFLQCSFPDHRAVSRADRICCRTLAPELFPSTPANNTAPCAGHDRCRKSR